MQQYNPQYCNNQFMMDDTNNNQYNNVNNQYNMNNIQYNINNINLQENKEKYSTENIIVNENIINDNDTYDHTRIQENIKKRKSCEKDIKDKELELNKIKEEKAIERKRKKEEKEKKVFLEKQTIWRKEQLIKIKNYSNKIKPNANVVFIGHVDAGKSTLCGQILLLTKAIDERTLQKYEQEAKENKKASWYLAYLLDLNEEEKKHGKTVEVGRAYFETEGRR